MFYVTLEIFAEFYISNFVSFPLQGLLGYHNYCRDPDNSGYLWCYVNEEGTRWEKCDVPVCREIGKLHVQFMVYTV